MAVSTPSKKTPKSLRNINLISLIRGSNDKAKKQLLMIVVFFICSALSLFLFTKVLAIIEENSIIAPVPVVAVDGEATKELDQVRQMHESVGSIKRITGSVMQTALLAESSGVLPVASEATLDQIAAQTTVEAPVDVPSDLPKVEPIPPSVTVTAIMIVGKEQVAMIDVVDTGNAALPPEQSAASPQGASDNSGLIVRKGSKFAGGTAVIKKIDSKGVTFRWMKKDYKVELEK